MHAYGAVLVALLCLSCRPAAAPEALVEATSVDPAGLAYPEAPRGDVLDRHGRVLATTRPAFGLQVIPNDLRRADVTFSALGDLLDADFEIRVNGVGVPAAASYRPFHDPNGERIRA